MNKLSFFSAKKHFSLEKVLEISISNIRHNQHLNAFINVYEDEARNNINKIDSDKPLRGMIVGVKDLFCYKDHSVTASSKILQGFISNITATCLERLINAGATIIGNQNCDEFAMGSSNENSYYGPVLHPLDNSKVPGGSSGGSAAAVKAGMCHISLGTDTGGSVRQPAAFCGVVGLKPTYSRISRYGVIAYASSFDTVGILANNIEDCAHALTIMAGEDKFDNTCYRGKVPNYVNDLDWNKKCKIAYFKETINHEGINAEIKDSIISTIELLKSEGHEIDELSFDLLEYTLPLYYILTTAEASANLSRYDGVRFGYRSSKASNIEELYTNTRTEGFGVEVKRRIILGTSILSEGYRDAYYTQAQRVRKIIKEYFDKILRDYDFIIMPTTPTTAFNLKSEKDPISMYLSDLLTVPASIAGVPAISIPNGHDKNGLPIGLQIIAGDFEEHKLLAFSKYLLGHRTPVAL